MIVTQSADVVQSSFTGLWYTVAQYLPAILAAIIVFIIGWIVGVILYRIVVEVARGLVSGSARAAGAHAANLAGAVAKWAIWIFAIMAALDQLQVASAFIQTLDRKSTRLNSSHN